MKRQFFLLVASANLYFFDRCHAFECLGQCRETEVEGMDCVERCKECASDWQQTGGFLGACIENCELLGNCYIDCNPHLVILCNGKQGDPLFSGDFKHPFSREKLPERPNSDYSEAGEEGSNESPEMATTAPYPIQDTTPRFPIETTSIRYPIDTTTLPYPIDGTSAPLFPPDVSPTPFPIEMTPGRTAIMTRPRPVLTTASPDPRELTTTEDHYSVVYTEDRVHPTTADVSPRRQTNAASNRNQRDRFRSSHESRSRSYENDENKRK